MLMLLVFIPIRYDSKSLKLAPEFSHTAPAVPVPTPLRPRDDANGDTETGEVNTAVLLPAWVFPI